MVKTLIKSAVKVLFDKADSLKEVITVKSKSGVDYDCDTSTLVGDYTENQVSALITTYDSEDSPEERFNFEVRRIIIELSKLKFFIKQEDQVIWNEESWIIREIERDIAGATLTLTVERG